MLHLTTQRQQTLQKQTISTYHLQTAKFIADTTIYLRLKYLYTCHTNDVTTFDITDETHRVRTFNDNWDKTLYDVKHLANEGFFSLSTTNTNIQCFSCGIIITKFPSNTPSFVLHLIASPNCKHLRSTDDISKPDKYSHLKILQTHPSEEHTLPANSDIHKEFHIQAAGFTRITTSLDTYYECSSCHGTYHNWKQEQDPWKIHAQYFPYCSHVINSKSNFFVKNILKQNAHQQFPFTTYYRYLK